MLLGVDLQRTDEPEDLSEILATVPDSTPVTLGIIRDEELFDVVVTPVDQKLGVYVRPHYTVSDIQFGIGESLVKGVVEMKNQVVLTFKVLGYMLSTWFTSDDSEARQEVAEGIG